MYRKIKRTVRNKFKKIFNDKLHEEEKTYQELFDPIIISMEMYSMRNLDVYGNN